ncbi:hypothetical protein [Vibrio aestuarianus]|uniref:Uncharacterized protein n=1 Tax=Vibrio aestuarianus TaxID=28171 RepID=A0ABD7YRA0_9VIBR|nr:hypothetical protein [Vibrio aestuarianus]WGK87294.1 hypothetical protein PYE67_14315 [Vibrio aestuarianus]WGK87346.1 hypothetical protein PYE67_14580 [Vibrio aestuarianus]CAH8239322.1 hypothetical protein VAEU17_5640002 [Vibrio aestuarianus]
MKTKRKLTILGDFSEDKDIALRQLRTAVNSKLFENRVTEFLLSREAKSLNSGEEVGNEVRLDCDLDVVIVIEGGEVKEFDVNLSCK